MDQERGAPGASRAEEGAARLRELITDATLLPGASLREAELAEQLSLSRNTLREVFRMLAHERLITLVPHKGAQVSVPSISSVIDIYRVRRIIEGQALAQSFPRHPAVREMREAVAASRAAREDSHWKAVGTANVAFHTAIVALADSARLSQIFTQLAAELRLAFGIVNDLEYLHAPFLERNGAILEAIEAGEATTAASLLETYLNSAERLLLAAMERLNVK